MHKLADSQRESTANSQTFDILRLSQSLLRQLITAAEADPQYSRREEPTTFIHGFMPLEIALTC